MPAASQLHLLLIWNMGSPQYVDNSILLSLSNVDNPQIDTIKGDGLIRLIGIHRC